jgi:hypothetical protein
MPKPLISDSCSRPRKADKVFIFGWIAIALATFVIYRAGYQFVRDRAAFWERNIAAAVAGER